MTLKLIGYNVHSMLGVTTLARTWIVLNLFLVTGPAHQIHPLYNLFLFLLLSHFLLLNLLFDRLLNLTSLINVQRLFVYVFTLQD